jgi:RNA polymerase sigma-70 factor (ECF subfamily)
MRHQTTTEEVLSTPTTNRHRGIEQAVARAPQSPGAPASVGDEQDIAVFEAMVAQCEDRAYRLAMQLVRSERLAQEILQRTFLSAWQDRRKLAGSLEFSRWVCRAVGKAALRNLNTAVFRGQVSSRDASASIRTSSTFWIRPAAGHDSDWATRPAEQLSSEDLYRHVRRAVDVLPATLRAIFLLCDTEAMPVEDAAEILDLPVAAARQNLQEARLAMRTAIGDYFGREVPGESRAAAPSGVEHRRCDGSFIDS